MHSKIGHNVVEFSWEEYKEYKQTSSQTDKLKIAIDFMRSYYYITNTTEMFDMLHADDIGEMMLNKRKITSAEELENFMYQGFNS